MLPEVGRFQDGGTGCDLHEVAIPAGGDGGAGAALGIFADTEVEGVAFDPLPEEEGSGLLDVTGIFCVMEADFGALVIAFAVDLDGDEEGDIEGFGEGAEIVGDAGDAFVAGGAFGSGEEAEIVEENGFGAGKDAGDFVVDGCADGGFDIIEIEAGLGTGPDMGEPLPVNGADGVGGGFEALFNINWAEAIEEGGEAFKEEGAGDFELEEHDGFGVEGLGDVLEGEGFAVAGIGHDDDDIARGNGADVGVEVWEEVAEVEGKGVAAVAFEEVGFGQFVHGEAGEDAGFRGFCGHGFVPFVLGLGGDAAS